MNDTILHIHNATMDLLDIAKIKKAKDGDVSNYDNYVRAAYELELYAVSKFDELTDKNDLLWKASLLRSAGWLAAKCGYYQQALRLAELGLIIPTDGYELSKLRDLKQDMEKKLAKKTTFQETFTVSGILSSADFYNSKVIVQNTQSGEALSFSVQKEQIIRLVRYFLGDKVEIDFHTNKQGITILKDIRLAA